MQKTIFTWDLGATKCTVGLIKYDDCTKHYNCERHFSLKISEADCLENLIEQLEFGLDIKTADVDAVCIGAAGHYDGEMLCHLDGVYPFPMPFAQLANEKKWPPFAVIHDYASIVCATFSSYMKNSENMKQLNDCEFKTYGRRVALGIGTGLGLKDGVLLPNGDFWLGKNEIGHIGITYPPLADQTYSKRHNEIMCYLKNSGPVNTFEEILSGRGIVKLYKFFYSNVDRITPEEVGILMRAGKANELLQTFAWYLGLFVGTVQLTFMPEGGTWITGGVTLNHLTVFDQNDFLKGIHASPAYLSQRQEYPLGILKNPQHALIGSAYYAIHRL